MKNSSKKFRYLLRKILCWKNSRAITGWSRGLQNYIHNKMRCHTDWTRSSKPGFRCLIGFTPAPVSQGALPPTEWVILKSLLRFLSRKGHSIFHTRFQTPGLYDPLPFLFRFETCCHLKVVSNFEMWSELHQCRCQKLVELTWKLIWNDVWWFPLFLWLSFAVEKDTLMLHPL